ncbi:f07228e8-00f6-48e1-8613-bbee905aee93 [Thermothielavioides terrestris]|uniref:F07228e8-00f6-48e1-8613-bbee905aee93 n=1 Tax=Thermothielavioides terrestris TaxID=2587410 RepID=A0A3S4B2Q3_9PEZI|nr:f07228e8-00f6-48e1-8613-bbee905aee93 [Thermothielavioides terrestris]
MADSDGSHPLDKESDDLVPLPAAHRRGLAVISALACLSVASSTAVLLYLTVKLVRWHWRNRVRRKATEASAAPAVDLSLGLSEHHLMGDDTKHDLPPAPKKAQINQFVVLIYNLLLADIHQSAAFLSNTVWLSRDGIYVRTSACWAQGWLVSTGDLASSLFITAIAVHTYLAVVRKYTPPQCAVYITVVGLWVFNYLIAALGVAITRNGRDTGGYFVRAAAWCWVNIRYENLRLYLHYLWIFIALAITIILYTLIFLSLRRRSTRPPPSVSDSRTNIHEHPPPLSASSSNTKTPGPPTTTTITTTTTALEPLPDGTTLADNAIIINSSNSNTSSTEGHHKAFLLYPLIYLLCTAPLALGRIATMAGADVPIAYFCAAGALITSNGWLDVLLWGATRHRLLFGADVDFPDDGDALATFAFMRTPHERRWGNMVWVEGVVVVMAAAASGRAVGLAVDVREMPRGKRQALPGLARHRAGHDAILYWLTESFNRAMLEYRALAGTVGGPVTVFPTSPATPFGSSAFPGEISAPPRAWAEQLITNLVFYKPHERASRPHLPCVVRG